MFARVIFGYFLYGQLPFLYLFSAIIFSSDLLFRYILKLRNFKMHLKLAVLISIVLSFLFALPFLFVEVRVYGCVLMPANDYKTEWVAVTFYLYVMIYAICGVFVIVSLLLSISHIISLYRTARHNRIEAQSSQPTFVRDVYFGQLTRSDMYYILLYPAMFMMENLFISISRIFTHPDMLKVNSMVDYSMYLKVLSGILDLVVFLLSPVLLRNILKAFRRRKRNRGLVVSYATATDSLSQSSPHLVGRRVSELMVKISPMAAIRRLSDWSESTLGRNTEIHRPNTRSNEYEGQIIIITHPSQVAQR